MNDKEMEAFVLLQDIKNLLETALDKAMTLHQAIPPVSHSQFVGNITRSIGNVNVLQDFFLSGDLQKQADIANQSADNDKTNKQ
jgi:hypothetical protein